MSNPITRKEKLLNSIANGENPQISPITREEQYLSFIAGSGNSIPDHPITREEIYLDKIARQGISGGGGTSAILVEKTITENGEYPATNYGADGFSKVKINVPSEIPDGYIKPTGTIDITEKDNNKTVDVSQFANAKVNIPTGSGEITLQEKTATENGEVTADEGYDGLSKVIVDVPSEEPNLISKTITENGTYKASEEMADGYSEVIVNVASGGGDEFPADKYFEGGYEEVVLPNATKLKSYAFYQDTTIQNVEMPKVTSIGDSAFINCTNLALTSLPSGLTNIGSGAFRNCRNLALTSLPSGLTNIGSSAFRDCTNLALTSLPSGLTSIENSAFDGCTNLALTSLPSGIIAIKTYAFDRCTNLALTSLPSGLRNLDGSTFGGCTSLTRITFKGTPTTINGTAFSGCTNLTTINVPWAEGAVKNAPWGATNATINYNYTGE
jgi:hypothetical protein